MKCCCSLTVPAHTQISTPMGLSKSSDGLYCPTLPIVQSLPCQCHLLGPLKEGLWRPDHD
jgi:hypothetical protein